MPSPARRRPAATRPPLRTTWRRSSSRRRPAPPAVRARGPQQPGQTRTPRADWSSARRGSRLPAQACAEMRCSTSVAVLDRSSRRASSSDWLKPRSRIRALDSGTGSSRSTHATPHRPPRAQPANRRAGVPTRVPAELEACDEVAPGPTPGHGGDALVDRGRPQSTATTDVAPNGCSRIAQHRQRGSDRGEARDAGAAEGLCGPGAADRADTRDRIGQSPPRR